MNKKFLYAAVGAAAALATAAVAFVKIKNKKNDPCYGLPESICGTDAELDAILEETDCTDDCACDSAENETECVCENEEVAECDCDKAEEVMPDTSDDEIIDAV